MTTIEDGMGRGRRNPRRGAAVCCIVATALALLVKIGPLLAGVPEEKVQLEIRNAETLSPLRHGGAVKGRRSSP